MRSLIDILDFSPEELQELIDTANDIIEHPAFYSDKCRGRKLATLFYEPSTRTRLSFEAAMYELGGNVLGFSEANSSSAAKVCSAFRRRTALLRPRARAWRTRPRR